MAYIDYSEYCDGYDKRYSSDMSIREDEAVRALLQKYIAPASHVLDVGSGTGYLLDNVYMNTEKYFGVDANPKMIEKAKAKYPEAVFFCGDASKMCGYKGIFDIAASLFSVPYIGKGSVDFISNALKETGYFIVVYYNKPYLNKDSVYYKRKLRYQLTVAPNVERFIRYANRRMICVEEGDLTPDKTYKYAVFMKGE